MLSKKVKTAKTEKEISDYLDMKKKKKKPILNQIEQKED